MTKTPLPSPRSPQELDEKILAYARQQLPAKKSYRGPLWLSGLATASVVVIAVLIVTPDQPDTIAPALESAAVAPASRKAKLSMTTLNSPVESDTASADIPRAAPQSASNRKATKKMMGASAVYAEQDMFAADVALDFDPGKLQEHLRQLASMLDNGATDPANSAYEALKSSCGDCDLPSTLAEAIEKYLGNN